MEEAQEFRRFVKICVGFGQRSNQLLQPHIQTTSVIVIIVLVLMASVSTSTASKMSSSNLASPFEYELAQLRKPNHVKRNYLDLRCRGLYNRALLTQLERVCEDCYNLFKDAEIHQYCRTECFSTQTFRQCLQSLLLDEDSSQYQTMVQIVGKKRKRKKK